MMEYLHESRTEGSTHIPQSIKSMYQYTSVLFAFGYFWARYPHSRLWMVHRIAKSFTCRMLPSYRALGHKCSGQEVTVWCPAATGWRVLESTSSRSFFYTLLLSSHSTLTHSLHQPHCPVACTALSPRQSSLDLQSHLYPPRQRVSRSKWLLPQLRYMFVSALALPLFLVMDLSLLIPLLGHIFNISAKGPKAYRPTSSVRSGKSRCPRL